MFLRKFTVIFVPLLLMLLVCVLLPTIGTGGFFTYVIKGLLLGTALSLLLPLSGASRRREPFGALLWVPLILTMVLLFSQYMGTIGTMIPVLSLLATTDGQVILAESAFCGFMLVTCIRTFGS